MENTVKFSHVDYPWEGDLRIATSLVENMRDGIRYLAIREQILVIGRSYPLQRALLDLSRVRTMSSLGVRVVVTLQRKVCEVEGRIAVTGLNGELRGLLFVCSLVSDDPTLPGPLEVATNRDDGLLRLRSLN